jgi:DNA polymerase type B, organellar and viral
MLKSAIRFVMKPKYHNYKIYLHNFSFFDGIFLLKILSDLTNIQIKPIVRDGRIIDLNFPFYNGNNKINLYFNIIILFLI